MTTLPTPSTLPAHRGLADGSCESVPRYAYLRHSSQPFSQDHSVFNGVLNDILAGSAMISEREDHVDVKICLSENHTHAC